MPIVDPKTLYNAQGVAKTRKFILEFCTTAEDRLNSTFSVSEHPNPEKVPMKILYMSLSVDDPSEVSFAEEVFGHLGFWHDLSETDFMKPYVERWRREADLKRKQKAFKTIIETATKGDTSASRLSAAKYLLEKAWEPKDTKARKQDKQDIKTVADSFKSDLERLQEQGLFN
jgi:hypothetical protein